jgi:tRNA dimethylallyltransferase
MTIDKNRFIYVLYGPTGVGKTACADLIARDIPVEILNMDVGQLYEPFSIGTAKPAWRSSNIPQHMFDILHSPHDFSCAAYRARVEPLIHSIWSRGAVPLFVGGSGFYARSLFFPLSNDTITYELPYKKHADLWDILFSIDEARALQISRNDRYRIERSLILWHTTGVKPSLSKPVFNPIAPTKVLLLTRDRQQLYDRINSRVDEMVHAGWLDEIAPMLNGAWHSFIMRKKLIGYDDLMHYVMSDQSSDTFALTIERIKKRTRNYAKRQETYGRMLEQELITAQKSHGNMVQIQRLNLTSGDIDLYIKRLLHGYNEVQ